MVNEVEMYMGGEPSEQELFEEVKNVVRSERIRTFDEYKSLIDDIVEDKLDSGFLDANEDIEQMKANLQLRWKDVDPSLERVVSRFS